MTIETDTQITMTPREAVLLQLVVRATRGLGARLTAAQIPQPTRPQLEQIVAAARVAIEKMLDASPPEKTLGELGAEAIDAAVVIASDVLGVRTGFVQVGKPAPSLN